MLAPSIAQATPSLPLAPSASDDDGGVGGAAGTTPKRGNRGAAARSAAADAAAPAAEAPGRAAVSADATGSNPLLQNSLWWFGTPNPTPPPTAYTRTFTPLANLPEWSLPSYGWFRNLNFEACVLGLGTTITPSVGPYGTSTNSVSTGGC